MAGRSHKHIEVVFISGRSTMASVLAEGSVLCLSGFLLAFSQVSSNGMFVPPFADPLENQCVGTDGSELFEGVLVGQDRAISAAKQAKQGNQHLRPCLNRDSNRLRFVDDVAREMLRRCFHR